MKKIGILLLYLVASNTFGLDYSLSSDVNRKKFLDQYNIDRKNLNKQDLFQQNNKQKWGCSIPQKEQYRLVKLLQDESFEQNVLNENMQHSKNTPVIKISNVQIEPIKTTCKDGEILGDIELRTEYDIWLEQSLSNLSSGTRLISKINKITLSHGVIQDGVLVGVARSFTKYTTQLKISSSESNEDIEFDHPITAMQFYYKDTMGNEALFIEDKKLNGIDYSLRNSFISKIDRNRSKKITYKDNQIASIELLKDGIPDGDQISYVVGNEVLMEMLRETSPNMDPKLVKIYGNNYIEIHMCMKNGVEVDRIQCMTKN